MRISAGEKTDETSDRGKNLRARGLGATGRSTNSPERLLLRVALSLARPLVSRGNINLHFFGREERFFLGDGEGEPVDIFFKRLPDLFRILTNPGLAIGETYVNRGWDIDEADLTRFIGYLLVNEALIEAMAPVRALNWLRAIASHVSRANTSWRSRRNAAHHYDLGNDLYAAFLDDEMVYSCAFFSREGQSLESAQKNKLEITLDRLQVTPGMNVLDIGCGWGAMTREIARCNARAVGISLANQQLTLAEQRLPSALRDLISYQLQDYRDHAEQSPEAYDRVVSIGMFEHVGRRHFVEYFNAIFRMLKPGGRALVHSIIKPDQSPTNAWIAKYIFPGGLIPQINDMTDNAEAAGLVLPHEPFVHQGHQYATTLRHWRKRFNQNFASLDRDRYNERFRRLWNFYLAASEAAFDSLGYKVAQMVVEKPGFRADRALPIR
jgi:cyclopropane-fatty-acyl-phospholipid synthase